MRRRKKQKSKPQTPWRENLECLAAAIELNVSTRNTAYLNLQYIERCRILQPYIGCHRCGFRQIGTGRDGQIA